MSLFLHKLSRGLGGGGEGGSTTGFVILSLLEL